MFVLVFPSPTTIFDHSDRKNAYTLYQVSNRIVGKLDRNLRSCAVLFYLLASATGTYSELNDNYAALLFSLSRAFLSSSKKVIGSVQI